VVCKTSAFCRSQNIADRRSVSPPYWLSRSPRLPVFSRSKLYYDNNRLFATPAIMNPKPVSYYLPHKPYLNVSAMASSPWRRRAWLFDRLPIAFCGRGKSERVTEIPRATVVQARSGGYVFTILFNMGQRNPTVGLVKKTTILGEKVT
jgi:hypothetical protein